METTAAAIILIVIGIAHSALGETQVIGPLIKVEGWRIPGIPRYAANPLLRFAWHLTTLAWFGLSAVLIGASITIVFAAVCLSAAALILALLPGHLAWPMFLAAGVLALEAEGLIARPVWWAVLGLAAALAIVAAGAHVVWAARKSTGSLAVIPTRPGSTELMFLPRAGGTLAVSGALLAYVALTGALAMGAEQAAVRWLVIAALVILTLRVVGEGRYVGVSKSVRGTAFADQDDRFWTPAVGLLAMGAWAALALA